MRTHKKAGKPSNVAPAGQVTASAEILKSIRQALRRDANEDPGKISVELLANKVVLGGSVRSVAEKEAAEKVARSLSGMNRVENKLLVEVPGYLF